MSSDGGPDSSLDLAAMIEQLGREFPFEVELSLGPLIRFWDEVIASEDSLRGRLARTLQSEWRRAPELERPIHDLEVVARRRDLVEALMAAVFPPPP